MGGTSPSWAPESSALFLREDALTSTYSESELYSPSLDPGVGGRAPGRDSGLPSAFPLCGLFAVAGRCENSEESGLVAFSFLFGLVGVNVSCPSGTRCRGLDRPVDDFGIGDAPRAFSRSSVALRRASRASSSEVCEETAFFLRIVRLAFMRGLMDGGNTLL